MVELSSSKSNAYLPYISTHALKFLSALFVVLTAYLKSKWRLIRLIKG
jgi:hypothetical protein